MKEIVAIIGSGTMGNGIAHLFAVNNYTVHLVDISSEQLKKALATIVANLKRQVDKEIITSKMAKDAIGNIQTSTSLDDAVKNANIIIEAATESLELKKKILSEIDQMCSPNAIIGTNTSSISISSLAESLNHPNRFIGMHFFNPVPVMQLVEVINGKKTDADTSKKVVEISEQLGKIPIVINDDPGFISNKVLMPMINEAIDSLHRGTAGVQEIDTIMQLGMAHPMGPLKLADFIGLDVCLNIMNVLKDGFGDKYSASPLLIELVAQGELGVKSGLGFYDWSTDKKNPSASQRFK